MIDINKFNNFLENIKLNLILNDSLIGNIISRIEIIKNNKIQTAQVYFDSDKYNYIIEYNENFLKSLNNLKEVMSIFKHEIYHVLFKHHFRVLKIERTDNYIDMEIANIAMDISINQYIENLPPNALSYKDYNFKKNLNFEEYYYLLLENNQGSNKNNKSGRSKSKGKEGENKNNKTNKEKQINNQKENKNKEKQNVSNKETLDEHNKLIKNIKNIDEMEQDTIENYTDNIIKDSFKNIKNDNVLKSILEKELITNEQISWKKIIKNFLDKSALSNRKKETWSKINKRFKHMKGKKYVYDPKILLGIDTSGSIKEEYIYNFVNQIKELSKESSISIIYFNHEIYNYISEYKNKDKDKLKNIQRGGTIIQNVLDFAKYKKYKNVIIMTDGYGEIKLNKNNLKVIYIKEDFKKLYIQKEMEIKSYNIFNLYNTITIN